MRVLISLLVVFGYAAAQSQTSNNNTASSRSNARIVCYFSEWAVYRPGIGRYTIKDIPVDMCSHLIYTFVGISNITNQIRVLDSELSVEQNNFLNFTSLREKHPNTKYITAVGGWNEGGLKFSRMVSTNSSRASFINSVVDFLNEYNFDGLDLDWDYPGSIERNGTAADKDNYLYLVQELRQAFIAEGKNWELTGDMPIAADKLRRGYHVRELCETFDAVHALTYDLRGNWDGFVDVHSPLFNRSDDLPEFKDINVDAGLKLLQKKGCPADKIIVGVPFFGRSFTLPNNNISYALGSPANTTADGGDPGPYTRTRGFKAYYEICADVKNTSSGWVDEWAEEEMCPYTHKGNQWIGYENQRSVEIKMNYIKANGYRGAGTWAIDMDDFRGICGEKNPLLKLLYKYMGNYLVPKSAPPPVDNSDD